MESIRYYLQQIKYFPKDIKWFLQRGKRGWSNYDTWSFDCYLAKVIAEGLTHLANNQMGCAEKFYDASKENDECWKSRKLMLEIAEPFKKYSELPDMKPKEWDKFMKEFKKNGKKFIDNFDTFWD